MDKLPRKRSNIVLKMTKIKIHDLGDCLCFIFFCCCHGNQQEEKVLLPSSSKRTDTELEN